MKVLYLPALLAVLQKSSAFSFATNRQSTRARPLPQASRAERQLIDAKPFVSAEKLFSQRPNSDELEDDDNESNDAPAKLPRADTVVVETSLGLKRASWLSWWSQMILTVTSAVILVFAKNVVAGSPKQLSSGAQVNFLLSGAGIAISFLSIFWTWGGGARLSRRLLRRATTRVETANMVRRAIRVGVSLNLIGMLVTLLGAEQTVGVLAIKVLTAGRLQASMIPATIDGLQPLDILVVQANTNLLFSHFCSLCSLLYMTGFVARLDPPSKLEGGKRQ